MSETKWTPAPWRWHWRSEDEATPGSVFAEPHEGHAYAVAMMPRYQTKEQWEADARLIAAAPDLLEACQAMLSDYESQFGMDYCECDSSVWLTCNACRARTAIAKAKGEL